LRVIILPGCRGGDDACGFEAGTTIMVFDGTGGWEAFTVTQVQGASLSVRHLGLASARAYAAGSYVTRASLHTYYLKTVTGSDTYQLMHYDGEQTDLPVADNIVGLAFEYFGDPQPPRLLRPVSDAKGPWTTYGPKPPALGVENPEGTYLPGENCTFEVTNGQHVPRLATLAANVSGLVQLGGATLTDGPWCPGTASPRRFDADLLRIRRVRITIRVQAGLKSLRGPAGPLFVHAGSCTDARRLVPDQEVRFDVTPRNLNLAR
jgi:hypothetical protein